MIRGFFGKDDFSKGIRKYLQKFAYTAAGQNDLWKSFENEKIAEVAENWINQKGFPILFVTVKSWSHDDLKGNLLTSSLAARTPQFIIV